MTGNWTFVMAAFTLTWIALLGYLMHLVRVTRRAREQYDVAVGVETRSGS